MQASQPNQQQAHAPDAPGAPDASAQPAPGAVSAEKLPGIRYITAVGSFKTRRNAPDPDERGQRPKRY
jgi:hypothetical protein